MDSTHILIVDDEIGIRFFLEETLQKAGYQTSSVTSGEEALAFLKDTDVDLIFLDLNLGGRIDGHRVLEAVKWRSPDTLVIILTAHASMDSALAAIREGVDGYLQKPVGPAEIRQVVLDVLNRRKKSSQPQIEQKTEPTTLEFKALSLDTGKHIARLNDELLNLTPSEFKLLAYFLNNPERVLPPRELVSIVRDYDTEDDLEAREIIKWYIHRLRHKIETDPSNPEYIINVRGVGYLMGHL
jgi:two-component system alkaline phosphatase synthesis response regulator PhoP